jgi:hypothetical protein
MTYFDRRKSSIYTVVDLWYRTWHRKILIFFGQSCKQIKLLLKAFVTTSNVTDDRQTDSSLAIPTHGLSAMSRQKLIDVLINVSVTWGACLTLSVIKKSMVPIYNVQPNTKILVPDPGLCLKLGLAQRNPAIRWVKAGSMNVLELVHGL